MPTSLGQFGSSAAFVNDDIIAEEKAATSVDHRLMS
jgi:hypothetical protein